MVEGQVVLKSNQNIQIELEWLIQDTGHELLVQFKGIETAASEETFVLPKVAVAIHRSIVHLSPKQKSLRLQLFRSL
jgi:hypothetical protein